MKYFYLCLPVLLSNDTQRQSLVCKNGSAGLGATDCRLHQHSASNKMVAPADLHVRTQFSSYKRGELMSICSSLFKKNPHNNIQNILEYSYIAQCAALQATVILACKGWKQCCAIH
jgi:hypothetical protein